jgi:phage terminase small subunit
MAKTEQVLTPQIEMFCSNFCAIGTETFSHKEKSAIAAGYSEKSAGNQATALLKRPEIWQRIVELHEQNMKQNALTVASVIADIRHDRDAARAAGKTADALMGDKLLGQTLALFADRQVVEPEKARELDADEQKEASELARLRLATKYHLSSAGVRADVKPEESVG